MKTAILYESWHHGNTKKLCDAIASACGADLYDVRSEVPDLGDYDLIGVASGIAYSKFYKAITAYVAENFPSGKAVFLLYTCGKMADFTAHIRGLLAEKGCTVVGSYGCRGYDTYGPLKLIGGLNKTSPTPDEIQGAVDFFKSLRP